MTMPAPLVHIFEVGDYEAQIHRAAELLSGDGLVVLPTETVYGAAGVLNRPRSLGRLKKLRGGGDGKPFTIHLAHRDEARRYIAKTSELSERMMKKLWPGPVGLIFDVDAEHRADAAAGLAVAEADLYEGATITLRCPDHIVATDVIGRVAGPVVLSTLGVSSPLTADPFAQQVADKVDMILDAGPSRYSKPSTLLRVHDDRYEIVRAGVYDERIIERLLRTTILFVCSGNTCRSPMAEAIARRVISQQLHVPADDLEKKGFNVLSAGSLALPGAKATPQAVDAVKTLGADLSRHRSRPLTVELVHQADVIFTMQRSHSQAVTALVPSAADKVETLDPGADVEDPIGGDQSLYSELADQLQKLIEQRLREKVIVG